MKTRKSERLIDGFEKYLINDEKARKTVTAYIHAVRLLFEFIIEKYKIYDLTLIEKEHVIEFKEHMKSKEINFEVSTINLYINGINNFINFIGKSEMKIKNISFSKVKTPEKNFTKKEVTKILDKAVKTGKQEVF